MVLECSTPEDITEHYLTAQEFNDYDNIISIALLLHTLRISVESKTALIYNQYPIIRLMYRVHM
jgi:hypothetical protein